MKILRTNTGKEACINTNQMQTKCKFNTNQMYKLNVKIACKNAMQILMQRLEVSTPILQKRDS